MAISEIKKESTDKATFVKERLTEEYQKLRQRVYGRESKWNTLASRAKDDKGYQFNLFTNGLMTVPSEVFHEKLEEVFGIRTGVTNYGSNTNYKQLVYGALAASRERTLRDKDYQRDSSLSQVMEQLQDPKKRVDFLKDTERLVRTITFPLIVPSPRRFSALVYMGSLEQGDYWFTAVDNNLMIAGEPIQDVFCLGLLGALDRATFGKLWHQPKVELQKGQVNG